MGNHISCASKGAALVVLAANGDVPGATELLKRYPRAAAYCGNFKDRSSPLIQASARGHFELVQLILETAVMTEGPERAKKFCIDHANSKRQTALMAACKHGHPDCVEYLVTNGADPLLTDERRKNTCLHFASLYGHSECVHKLLGSRVAYRMQGRQVPVAQIPCPNGEDAAPVKFIDRHNGWGLTALHIAVFQGSVSTVRALLRHGADLECVIAPSQVENSPIRCAVGSNVLHIAALMGNIAMAKLILEAQEGYPGLELRSRTNGAGLRPQDYAQRARNPVLVHLLDERLPVALLRQIWMNYSLEQSMPPRHQTLDAMLQKLKLMFNLETIAIQRNLDLMDTELAASPDHAPGNRVAEISSAKVVWLRRKDDVAQLLTTVSALHNDLRTLCKWDEPQPEGQEANWQNRSATYEAVLDFILSTLITPRTVSAILHAAKKLVSASVSPPTCDAPSGDADAQHGLALLNTALRAVETCLQAAGFLTSPANLEAATAHARAGAGVAATSAAGCEQPAGGEAAAAAAATAAASTSGAAAATGADASSSTGALGAALPGVDPAAALAAAALVLAPGTGTRAVASTPRAAALSMSPGLDGTTAATALALQAGGVSAAHAALFHRPPDGSGPAMLTSHWSAHLHTLIAQLQWDIGVQRHRRRRAHAAAAAARNAAAAAAAGGGAAAAAAPPAAAPGAQSQQQQQQAAGTATDAVPPTAAAATTSSRSAVAGSATPRAAHHHHHHHTRRGRTDSPARRSLSHSAAVYATNPSSTPSHTVYPAAASPLEARVAAVAVAADGNSSLGPGQLGQPGQLNALLVPPGTVGTNGSNSASATPRVATGGAAPASTTDAGAGQQRDDAAAAAATAVDSDAAVAAATASAYATPAGSQEAAGPNSAPPAAMHLNVAVASGPAAPAAAGPGAAAVNDDDDDDPDDSGPHAQQHPPRPTGLHHASGLLRAAVALEIGEAVDDEEEAAEVEAATGSMALATMLSDEGDGEGDGDREQDMLRHAARAAADAGDGGDGGGAAAGVGGHMPPVSRGRWEKDALGAAAVGATASSTTKARGCKDGNGTVVAGAATAASETSSEADWSGEEDEERNMCSICMDLPVAVLVAGCHHGLCVQCAFQLCVKGRELPSCPFCRQKIGAFEVKPLHPAPLAPQQPQQP